MGKRSNRSKKKLARRGLEGEHSQRDQNVYPKRTNPKGYRYLFHPKHHVPPKGDHACWLASISREVEFDLFETAVRLDLADDAGNLYNVQRDEEGDLIHLGHNSEQIAFFWKPRSEMEWHGYPVWPLITRRSTSRKKQMNRPPTLVFEKLVQTAQLTSSESDRLKNGKNA